MPWTYVIKEFNEEEIFQIFYEKELQNTDRKDVRVEKVIKKKGDKLYVKRKVYDSSFNGSIDKKGIA